MTFVLKAVAAVSLDVSIQVPGEKEPSTITATWKLHKWDEFQARFSDMQAGTMTDEDLVEQDLVDLGGIRDEKGEPLPFNPELVQELLQLGYVRRPLIASWFEAQNGRAKAAAKN